MKRKKRNIHETPAHPKQTPDFLKGKWYLYPIIIISFFIVVAVLSINYLSKDLPSLTELERAGDPLLVTRIYSADGKVMKELFKQRRIQVSLDRIPENVIEAAIATEDRKFYSHWGLDLKRIGKAAFIDIVTMSKAQGASTITGQLARQLYLSLDKKWTRKLQEALTVLQIERTYSKSEILEMYLNHMYYGHGTYGLQAASLKYFGKSVDSLRVEESAFLVGVLQRPAYFSPYNHMEDATKRRNVVLKSMSMCEYITVAEYDSLSQLPLKVVDIDDDKKTIAPYFCEHVRREMEKIFGIKLVTDGYSIYTTLDTRVQACADSAANSFLPGLEKDIWANMIKERRFVQWLPNDSAHTIEAFLADTVARDSVFKARATLQTALVAIEPGTGHVKAMIGGRDFEKSKFNRAVQAVRQPGSNFKPFVYTVAIDNGYSPSYELYNLPVVIHQVDGTRWHPQNYDKSTGGLTTLREALTRSLNLVSVRLVQEVIPPEKIVSYAKRFGFTTTIHPYDAIALGSDVVYPIELASAFSVFANNGVRIEPICVTKVVDKNGDIIYQSNPKIHEVISEETTYIIRDMLQSVMNHERGTATSARWKYHFYRTAAAGKTGTTNDFTDAWFSGFTPQLEATVWVGFDNPALSLGNRRSGATTALPIWAPFMRMAHDTLQLPLTDWETPPGILKLNICTESKELATEACPNSMEEIFTQETAPTRKCHLHSSPQSNSRKRQRNGVF